MAHRHLPRDVPDYVWENALELLFGRISQRRSQAVTVTVPTP